MDIKDVMDVPGFEVLEHQPGHTVLTIPSGYTLTIRRVGPYTFDHLDSREDLKDPGPFTIKVRLLEKLQPPGVEEEILYRPPTDDDGKPEEPDREQHERAWMYYQQWQMHQLQRTNIIKQRDNERNDLALLTGIKVQDGSVDVDDNEWLECLGIDTANLTRSQRMLLFLKTEVIRSITTADIIRFFIQVKEVNVDGLKRAFDSFWRIMAR